MKILITGSAGFIGFHLAKKLLNNKNIIYGIDNLNDYYDVNLKNDRNKILKRYSNFFFKKIDITNFDNLNNFVKSNKIKIVIHLAAQAGVRYSINNPNIYTQYNLLGFFNICEVAKLNKIKHLLFASTSSVYGDQKKFPVNEDFDTNMPQSYYAATKKSNEVLAFSYSSIHKLSCTGLRFFTVYGPFGRPDMSLFIFVDKIINRKPINVFNKGNHVRDFTYIDDVVKMISSLISKRSKNKVPYQVFNITNSNPKPLSEFINAIKKELLLEPKINYLGMQKGDVIKTHGSNVNLKKVISLPNPTTLKKGVKNFINWYKKYYLVKEN